MPTPHEKMLTQDALMRDPNFSLRILWGRQILLFLFLLAGIVSTVLLIIRAFSDIERTTTGSRFGPILIPVCWTVFVFMMIRNGMARVKSLKDEIAQRRQWTEQPTRFTADVDHEM